MQHRSTTEIAGDLARQMQAGCLGSRVGRLHRIVARHFDQALRAVGLSLAQMELLGALEVIGRPVRPGEVADILSVERSTMSRNVALLVQRGLVDATQRSPSGRCTAITISAEGVSVLAEAATAWQVAQDHLSEVLGGGAPATFDRWLDDLGRPMPAVS